ncbi:HlyC/CorC family transporter [Litoribacter ruber]|uniref:CNNM domain-containing protein n=1 Tax=Litoribacter ruber TaxID=702568 RepID=UPI001BDA54D1|nr:hemolysin family protein [Litoribacter ruber]MBT0810455.1 HlyC/CorC family transporter [Litoribacter ruber]
MTLLLFYLLLALGISFVCSLLEASLLSISPSYIETQIQEGKSYAGRLKELKTNIDRPLAAILSFNTIAHTVGAAGVGAEAVRIYGNEFFGIISAVLTILILVLSEIFPKSLGAAYWKKIAPYMGGVLAAMIWILYPVVIMSEKMTKVFSGGNESTTSREEVAALTHIATKEGWFAESESKIIHNLIMFKTIQVHHVMTPRTVTLVLDEETTLKDFFVKKEMKAFSRIPLYRENIDNITGYILKFDAFEKLVQDEFDLKLKQLKRPITIVQATDPIPDVLELLLNKREHIAMVVDGYGGMSGIVTMEDILETLLGLEIQDESDAIQDMQDLARTQWKIRAAKMGIKLPPSENID